MYSVHQRRPLLNNSSLFGSAWLREHLGVTGTGSNYDLHLDTDNAPPAWQVTGIGKNERRQVTDAAPPLSKPISRCADPIRSASYSFTGTVAVNGVSVSLRTGRPVSFGPGVRS